MKRAVFLDRDGVINQPQVRDGKSYPPDQVADFKLCDGVAEACKLLHQAGFLLIVVTNQPDVRTGKQRLEILEAMHAKMQELLPLDGVYACFHIDADNCLCRKPATGMLTEAALAYDITLQKSFLVGDRWRDVLAGQRAGCSCYYIDYGYKEVQPDPPFVKVASLLEASRHILSHDSQILTDEVKKP